MWPFTSKKVEAAPIPDVVQTLTERYLDVNTRLLALEASEKAFRDKVLRKIQKSSDKSEDSNTDRPGIIGYGNRSREDAEPTQSSRIL